MSLSLSTLAKGPPRAIGTDLVPVNSTHHNLAHWYQNNDPDALAIDPASAAFEQGLKIFKQKLTADPKKRAKVDSLKSSRLEDVIDVVRKAQESYSSNHGGLAHRTLSAFSKRIAYYGSILDVLVQHHPEYVALAWGAMKFLFVLSTCVFSSTLHEGLTCLQSVLEHERLNTTMVSAFCDIGDALRRVELAGVLYRTEWMQQTIAMLYAHIIKFLIRSLEWYEESKLMRAIHTITKPAALRYDDIILDIEKSVRKVSEVAMASSHAEQRDMHQEVVSLAAGIRQLQAQIVKQNQSRADQDTHDQLRYMSSLLLEMHKTLQSAQATPHPAPQLSLELSDIHVQLTLENVGSACSIDHKSSFQASVFLRNRRQYSSRAKCKPFWISPRLHAWNTSPRSDIIILRATFRDRLQMRDFCTNAIEQLLLSDIATVYILKSQEASSSLLDILRSLFYQIIEKDSSSRSDIALTAEIRRFQEAFTTDDHVDLLCETLSRFNLVYMLVDSEQVVPEETNECRRVFQDILRRFSSEDTQTIVKVLIVTSGPRTIEQRKDDGFTLRIPRTSQRKGKKLPREPLRMRSVASQTPPSDKKIA